MLYGEKHHFVNFPGLFKKFENNKNLKFVNFSGTALCLGPTSLHEGVFSKKSPGNETALGRFFFWIG